MIFPTCIPSFAEKLRACPNLENFDREMQERFLGKPPEILKLPVNCHKPELKISTPYQYPKTGGLTIYYDLSVLGNKKYIASVEKSSYLSTTVGLWVLSPLCFQECGDSDCFVRDFVGLIFCNGQDVSSKESNHVSRGSRICSNNPCFENCQNFVPTHTLLLGEETNIVSCLGPLHQIW